MAESGRPVEVVHAAVGMRVRLIREAVGITQAELAARLPNLDRTSIANIEAGRQRHQLHTIEEMARALGSTPRALMKGIWW